MPLSPKPVIPVRINGKVVPVIVCWSQERVQAILAQWPDGVVDASPEYAFSRPNGSARTGNAEEREWLVAQATKLAASKW